MSLAKCLGIAGTFFVGVFAFCCVLNMIWNWKREANEEQQP